MKSFMASPSTIERKWYVVDATGHTLLGLQALARASPYGSTYETTRSRVKRLASLSLNPDCLI